MEKSLDGSHTLLSLGLCTDTCYTPRGTPTVTVWPFNKLERRKLLFFLSALGAILPREQPVPRLLCGIMVIEHITRKVGTYSYDNRSNNLWGSF